MTIVAKGRRLVLILHFEAKYAKMDCKNEIYVKNWVKSTGLQKSTVKVNDQSKSTPSDDVSKMTLSDDVS